MALIGLIDVDNEYRGKVTFPNLPLMKLSAWHKAQGDTVEWYDLQRVLSGGVYDKVYVSKVFSDEYTPPIETPIGAKEVVFGGSGYAISVENQREVYHKEADQSLPYEVEHIYPDYSLYGELTAQTSYGFLTRGCPRGCDFCHVAPMQGRASHTVARLNEFWHGQKNIELCDPNILACPDWRMHFEDLIASKAYVDFNQGLDIRLLTEEKIELLNQIKYKAIHFAWDRPEEDLRDKFRMVKEKLKRNSRHLISCYILTNSGSTHQQDVDRVEFIKSLQFQPYVMVYRAGTAPRETKQLKRYANNPFICWAVPTFDDYVSGTHSKRFGKTGVKYKQKTTIDGLKGESNGSKDGQTG